MTCIRCKGELVQHEGRWHCSPRCMPSGFYLHDTPDHNCDGCGKQAPSRGLVGTPEGVFCSAECVGQSILKQHGEQERCPACDDGPTSERYGGTCSPVCEGELVRLADTLPPPRQVAEKILGSGEWSHRIVRGGAA